MPLNKLQCADCGHSQIELRPVKTCPKCNSTQYTKVFPKHLTTGAVDKAGKMATLHIQETKEQIKELRKEKW